MNYISSIIILLVNWEFSHYCVDPIIIYSTEFLKKSIQNTLFKIQGTRERNAWWLIVCWIQYEVYKELCRQVMLMVAQQYDYTQYNWIVHLKWLKW